MDNRKMTIGKDADGNLLVGNTVHGDLIITSYDIVPNNYHDLRQMEESKKINIRLLNVIAKDFKEPFSLELIIENDTIDKSFLLVKDGWIPCNFMKKNTLLLADRNIISEIKRRYFINERRGTEDLDYFDSIFLTKNGLLIDLTLWVLEANERQIPSVDTMDRQLSQAKEILKTALPNIEIAEYEEGNKYYHKIANHIKNTLEKRMDFLFKTAPLINKQFTSETRIAIIPEIFKLATDCNISHYDIAVILVFLRINMAYEHEKDRKNTAQKVTKDSQEYTLENAYNTACDLAAIEWQINLIRKHESANSGFNIAFMTNDKGLAELGSLMLNQKDYSTDGHKITMTISFPMDIFSDSLEALKLIKKYLP